MHRDILKDAGYEMDMITLELPREGIREFLGRIGLLPGNTGIYGMIKAITNTVRIAKMVDELKVQTFRVRAEGIVLKEYRQHI